MKKILLIIIAALLLSVTGNCQWYQRRYDVNDINQLSQEQLNEAFLRARGGARAYEGVFLVMGSVPKAINLKVLTILHYLFFQ